MATITADSACCTADSTSRICSGGDKPSSSSPLADGDIRKIVERKLRTDNFRLSRWSLDLLGEPNGFLGQYYNLRITVEIGDGAKTLKFFAKTPPPPESPQYEFLVRFDTFDKEIIVYNEIFEKMGRGSGPKWMPDCYLGKSNAIIVLEDAGAEGYVTPDKHVPFDEDHCVWVVRALSVLHSRSIVLDEKLRRTDGRTIGDLYGHLLNEVLFAEQDERSRRALASCVKGACALVDFTEGLTPIERTTIKARLGRWAERLPALLEPSRKFRNALCHRDIWANNIMFKRDSQGKPIGCYAIDFQFLRYCPPALDLNCVLYLTTDRAVRDRYDHLVDVYRDSTRQQLAAEGLEIEEILPRAEFVQSCKYTRRVAIIYAIMNLQVMLLSNRTIKRYFEGRADILEEVLYGDKRGDLVTEECRNVPAYAARIADIIYEIRDRIPDYPPGI